MSRVDIRPYPGVGDLGNAEEISSWVLETRKVREKGGRIKYSGNLGWGKRIRIFGQNTDPCDVYVFVCLCGRIFMFIFYYFLILKIIL